MGIYGLTYSLYHPEGEKDDYQKYKIVVHKKQHWQNLNLRVIRKGISTGSMREWLRKGRKEANMVITSLLYYLSCLKRYH